MLLSLALSLPALAAPSEADAAGAAIAAACGDPYALDALEFTFIAEAGGVEKARRRHVWSPRQGTLAVTAGEETVRLRTGADMPSTPEDPRWATLAPGVDPAAALTAWSRFVNDSYWLLAACKVMDPGVNRALTPEGYLALSFGQVGLTPGDRYVLEATATAPQPTGWSFHLESGREDHLRWLDYQQVGPLSLSLRRESDSSGLTVRFEQVSAR